MDLPPFLYHLHIGMGTVGLLSGAGALVLRKGSSLHRATGNVFFVSMLFMSALGALAAYLATEGASVIAGSLTFYLVATAWVTVMRREGVLGRFEVGAMLFGLAVGAIGLAWGVEAARSEIGNKDGFPAAIYFVFGGVALLSAIGDARMIARRGVAGVRRIVRHLWRMCFALFIAAASLFLGQPNAFPESVRGTWVLAVPVLWVVGMMLFWLVRVRFRPWTTKP